MNVIEKNIVVEAIVDGTFAKSNSGNFNGKNNAGERFHINKAQMEKLGMSEQANVKTFYAIVTTNTYNELVTAEDITDKDSPYFEKTEEQGKPKKDAEGNVITFDRPEATAVFKTYAEADNALTSSAHEAELARLRRENEIAQLRQENADALAKSALESKISLSKLAKENDLTIEAMQALAGVSL